MKVDNISQLGDYDAPFCAQQYRHGLCYISLFKFKSFDQLISPKLPQILDIYSVVALLTDQWFLDHRRFHHIQGILKCLSREKASLNIIIQVKEI